MIPFLDSNYYILIGTNRTLRYLLNKKMIRKLTLINLQGLLLLIYMYIYIVFVNTH